MLVKFVGKTEPARNTELPAESKPPLKRQRSESEEAIEDCLPHRKWSSFKDGDNNMNMETPQTGRQIILAE